MSEVFISSFDSRLEGRYFQSDKENAPLALILQPDPKLGETMNNKVVYTLFQAFVALGFSVLRFNFRGVGKSTGKRDDENWMLTDAINALDWLQSTNINSTVCVIAGVGEGSLIGMQLLMRRPELSGFVSVSPMSASADYSFLAPCPSSGLFIQDGKNNPEKESMARALAERLNAQKNVTVSYVCLPEADIYYTNNLKNVYNTVLTYVPKILKTV